MTAPVVVSQRAAADLATFAKFFGFAVDDFNRHIFRAAAQADPKAFETIFSALARAVEQDSRHGFNQRLRNQLAAEKRGRKP